MSISFFKFSLRYSLQFVADPGVVVHCFRTVDVMVMTQVYFQSIFLGVLPVWSSKYMMLIQDPVFIPVVMKHYAEITGPAIFIVKNADRMAHSLFLWFCLWE